MLTFVLLLYILTKADTDVRVFWIKFVPNKKAKNLHGAKKIKASEIIVQITDKIVCKHRTMFV